MNNVDFAGEFANVPSLTVKGQTQRPLRLIFAARKFENMAGGLERISIDLMNEMARRGHAVGLMTWDRDAAVTHYPLDSRVKWLRLDIGNPDIQSSFADRMARLKRFRSFVKEFKSDVILGFQSGAALFSRVATMGMGIQIIAAERVSPDMWRYVRTGLFHKITDIYSLMMADRITVQFPDYKQKYPRILRRKIVAIHNPVFEMDVGSRARKSDRERLLLYVARLCFQKNHRLLIDAFARLPDSLKNWKLVLAGDGEYDSLLREHVSRLGLDDRVMFCGAVKDVDAWYRVADLVAFPSLFEGFPNALAEALSWGIPCIGLKDTLGVNSLIEDMVNGLLVDATPEAFSKGLVLLMNDPGMREHMSVAAQRISSMYAPQRSYDLWESLIRRMVSC